MIVSVIVVIISLGIVIFVHELGHFIVAKRTGIRVEKFFVGMGPELIGVTYGETRYGIGMFPIGGVVKLAGEESGEGPPKEGDFFYQPWYRRIYLALAGSLMNLILAIFLFFLTIYIWGEQKPADDAIIGGFSEPSPAYQSGMRENDLITKINGNEIHNWNMLAEYIHARPEELVTITVLREGEQLIFGVTPRRSEAGIGLIGITPMMTREKFGFFESVKLGVLQSVGWNYATLRYLGSRIKRFQAPEVSGPVGIVQVMTRAVSAGADNYLFILAIISNSLALFNLFPIPLLDGGHIVLFLIEGAMKKPIDKKYVEKINMIGLALILSIFIFVTYSDLLRLF